MLCVCDGVSIADNQTYITEAWLMRGNKVSALIIVPCLYFLSLFLFIIYVFTLHVCTVFTKQSSSSGSGSVATVL